MTDQPNVERIPDALSAAFRRYVPMSSEKAFSLLEVIARHGHAEKTGDLETTLATVCDTPEFSFEPLGWVIRDKALLHDFYLEALPLLMRLSPLEDWNPLMLLGEASIGIWDSSLTFRNHVGEMRPIHQMAVVTLDEKSGLVLGENIFMSAEFAEAFEITLSAELKQRLRRSA